MGGIAPVVKIDGRAIGSGRPGSVTTRLTGLLAELAATTGTVVGPSVPVTGLVQLFAREARRARMRSTAALKALWFSDLWA
jgi:hypothetical protein